MTNFYMKESPGKKWFTTFRSMMLMLLFVTASIGLKAQLWNINYCSGMPGATQSSLYGPMYSVAGANATSRTASIYTSTELAGIAAQQLTSIYWHTENGNAAGMLGTPNLKIYLLEMTASDWGAGALDWSTAIGGATLVFDGNPAGAIGNGGGWKQFVLTTPFTYSGTQNLAVITEYHNPVASNAIGWSYEYTSPCIAPSSNTTKYSNNTTGTLPTSLGSSNARRAYIGFDFPVSCNAPANVVVSAVTQTGAQIDWVAGGTETLWEYVLQPAGAGAPTSGTQIGTPSLTLTTQLTANTNYEFYIRSNCGGTDGDSVWKGPYTFKTLCGPVTSMFENFDTYATGSIVPDCWVRLTPPASSGSQTITSTTPASGTRNIYQYASATQNAVIVVLPEFTNVNAGTHWLRFKARVSSLPGDLEVGYVTDAADYNSFVTLSVLSITNTVYTAPDSEYTVIVPNTVPAGARLAIRNPSDAKSYYWDDVYWEPVPTCFVPENTSVASIAANTADVTWTAPTPAPANGYDVYYSTVNTAPTASTVLDATNSVSVGAGITTATIPGLTPATTYYVWVRSNCGAGDLSAWAEVPSFVTACLAFAVPYAENFDTTATGSSSNNNAPTCWTYYEAPGSTGYGYVYGTATNVLSPPNSYYLYRSSSTTGEMMLISPNTTALSDGTNRVRFSAKSTNSGTLEVGTMDNPANPSGFTVIQTFTLTNTFEEYTVNLPVGTDTYFAFNNSSSAAGNAYIDDIFVEDMPSCVEPTSVTVSNILEDNATLNWVDAITLPATYDIYISTNNTPPSALTSPTISGVSGTSTSLGTPPLTPSTTYYVWVRSNCGAGDVSIWTEAVSFTTMCDAPAILSVVNGTVCGATGTANLSATGEAGATLNWYSTPTGGTALGTGNTFTTPTISATTSYYVGASTGTTSTQYVGPVDPSMGTTSAYGTDHYRIFFTVNTDLTFAAVDIFPTVSGASGVLGIYDAATDALLHSIPFTTTVAGSASSPVAETVDLNVQLSAGDYYIKQAGTSVSLLRNTTGASFPYSTPELSITGHNFNGYPQYYYFFYNFRIVTGCESPRQEVIATVDPNCTMSTVEVAGENDVQVYPNPFTDIVHVSDIKDVKRVTVLDMAGRVVKTISDPERALQLGDLKSGMYILKLDYKDGVSRSAKVIKK